MSNPRLVGKTIAHYEVFEHLGSGGMGTVYGARDTKMGRVVAIKVLPEAVSKDPTHLRRFKREARALAAVNHPNIATIYGIEDEDPSICFLVLERVDGESLADRIRRGPIPYQESLRICRFIALALNAAHDEGIIHRDLKPGNVMVSAAGVVKVLDFGIARLASEPTTAGHHDHDRTRTAVTEVGHTTGTPAYMSPEQIRAADQDSRTDVFAFGCVLFEAMTGAPAFQGATSAEIMASVLYREPDWLALPGAAPSQARDFLRRCLEKDPERRLRDMGVVREELDALLQGRVADRGGPTADEGAKRHNLPAQLTSFVGREREVAECTRQLEQSRLVTLTGVGGSGKSRLMLRVAETVLNRYPDGVWLVDLGAFSDPARSAATLAGALGLREVPGESLSRTIAAHLRDRKALLLFDNCEHMLAPIAEQITALLRECSGVRVLATSREALRTAGEQGYPVPPLSLPDARVADAETAGAFEAVRLFVERARQVRASFALDAGSTPIVVDICRQLDGIPLALELAAARMKMLSPAEIRSRLEDRFRLLTGGSRTVLSRHQTLRATIQWSYDHLNADEQRLLRGLSVFAGGWTLEAATAVGGVGGDEFEVLDLLSALAEKSLVIVDRAPATESRYRFLETVRQYALERLTEAGEEGAWRSRHLDSVLALVERAEPELIGPDQEAWFKRLEAEHENILSALRWCAHAEGGVEKALRMGGALWRFWWFGGHFSLGLACLEAALDQDRSGGATPERAQALYAAAQMARELGDLAQARELFQRSLEVAEALGDLSRIARAYNGLGNTAEYAGDYASARAYHEKSLGLSRALKNERAVAIDLHNLGIVLMIQREYGAAGPLFEEALGIFRRIGDVNGAQATVDNLATIATQVGQLEAARTYFAESFRLAEELPSQTLTADSLESFAVLAVEVGALELAARILGTADAVRHATGYAPSVENRGIIDATVSRIRAELGERRHAELDTEGRAMTFDAAVRSVRHWLADAETQA